jgi:antitoxin (DNA-binding transcriptional repressor) of toxin-antitoxin stability system
MNRPVDLTPYDDSIRKTFLDKEASRSYLEDMRSVGLKVLKNRLSEYVRLAASGERVLVTDRDRVVAELVPPAEGRTPMLSDTLLAEAVRRGHITPAHLPPGEPPRRPTLPLPEILRGLDTDREDR